MALMSWVDLRERSPINIDRLVGHAQRFDSYVSVRISTSNIEKAKRSLMDARCQLDLMITTLQQILYDKSILKGRTDEILYMWLVDNFGRYLGYLDKKETALIITHDSVNDEKSRIGIGRLSAYSKLLKIASQSLIYECLFKAIEEYDKIDEDEQTKRGIKGKDLIKKDLRSFLYILFQLVQLTLFSLGGLARDDKSQMKKGMVNNTPISWSSLMRTEGQQRIAKDHKEKTGEEVEVPEDLPEEETEEPETEVVFEENYEGEEHD